MCFDGFKRKFFSLIKRTEEAEESSTELGMEMLTYEELCMEMLKLLERITDLTIEEKSELEKIEQYEVSFRDLIFNIPTPESECWFDEHKISECDEELQSHCLRRKKLADEKKEAEEKFANLVTQGFQSYDDRHFWKAIYWKVELSLGHKLAFRRIYTPEERIEKS